MRNSEVFSDIMQLVADSPQAHHKSKKNSKRYRPEIDGLRAFAVVAVIINHFNKDLLAGGYLGVDIFFVISGYVITSSLLGRESKNFGDFLSGFYERRIKRLLPALIVFVLVTSILICMFDPEPEASLDAGIRSLFGLSNIYLFNQSADYFAQSTELNPFTHTWSLGVEEQFYLLFPFLVWFSGFGKQAQNGARNLFFVIAVLTIISLTSFIFLYQSNQPAAYFLMPPRFWEMAAGCLVFIGFQKRAKIEKMLEKIPPLFVLAVMVGVMTLPLQFAVPATIAIVILTAILIACMKNGTAIYTVFTNKRVVYIGLISYSLYLWHWGVLSVSRWSVGVQWWTVSFQLILMAVLAISSYELVEKRFRQGIVKRRLTVISAGVIAVSVAALIVRFTGSQKNDLFVKALYDVRQSESFVDVNGNPFDPTCVVDGQKRLLSSKTFEKCTVIPLVAGAPTLWVFGDSHAGHLNGMLDSMHKRYGIGFHLIETPGKPFPLPFKNAFFEEQQVIFNEAKKRMKRGDILLLARLYINRADKSVMTDFERWTAKVSDLVKIVNEDGIRVAVMLPIPFFSADSVSCNSSLLSRLNSSCWQRISEYHRVFEPVNARLKAMGDSTGVILVDPTKVLCSTAGEVYCPRNKDATALYRDGDHLNSFGSSRLSDFTKNTLLGEAY